MNWRTILALLLVLAASASAHIGSPNVFVDGQAGNYALHIAIRPPPTLPGTASVSVRIPKGAVDNVTVRALPTRGNAETSPPAVEAKPEASDPKLFTCDVWLFERGGFRFEVNVEGPAGSGVIAVPFDSAAIQRPPMSTTWALVLVVSIIFLGSAAVVITKAAAREGFLQPESNPDVVDIRRGRRAGIICTIVLVGGVSAAAARWKRMDRDFQRYGLHQPVPVEAAIRSDGDLHRLIIQRIPSEPNEPDWKSLVPDHGKLMHLFLVKVPDAGVFAHLHPARTDGHTFEAMLPPLPNGDYQIYSELTYQSGTGQTLIGRVSLPNPTGVATQPRWTILDEAWCNAPFGTIAPSVQPIALDVDDSWHVGLSAEASSSRTNHLSDGNRLVFESAHPLIANREVTLRFTAITPSGERVRLQPYMGMFGHAVIRKLDGEVFTHLHPVGTISMAAQAIASGSATPVAAISSEDQAYEVTFPYAFPQPGRYRLWVQVRIDGKVQTGGFDVLIES